MADDKERAPRARPFTPPLPPFRGPTTASRPPVSALRPPDAKRGSLFVGTRVPSKSVVPPPEVVSISALAPAAAGPSVDLAGLPDVVPNAPDVHHAIAPAAVQEAAEPAAIDSPRAEAIAATEAMPWLFADPGASKPVGGPPADDAAATTTGDERAVPTEPELEAALSGLPYFDGSGASRRADPIGNPESASNPEVRLNSDVAGVFESIAAKIRRGEVDASNVDPASGEAAILATVLATLLRKQGR